MAKKIDVSLEDMLKTARKELKHDSSMAGGFIPDVITFCEHPAYLGLREVDEDGIEIKGLRPMQKIILKIFYRGSKGNENLRLTDEELELCHKYEIDTNEYDRGNIIEKYNTADIFNELVLVWGRRSGKTFLFSVIALYEALKLLELPGGDPYAYYSLGGGSEISILTVASASDQAGIAFDEIKEKILQSRYFEDKFIIPDGICSDSIHLLTPKDKKMNEEARKKGMSAKKGSIVIEVGHSNSSSLRGKAIFVLLLDEIAAYKMSGGPSSDERIYNSLEPSVMTYVRKVPVLDEFGNPILDSKKRIKKKAVFDGKIISISSPMGKEGKLYDLFVTAPQKKHRLACRLPTWWVNPTLTEEDLREKSDLSDDSFMQEYGAEFSGTSGESFFPRDVVEDLFKDGRALSFKEMGEPGIAYFVHIDPATTSHNYSLVVVHREMFFNKDTHEPDYRIVVDHIKYWRPMPGKPVNTDEVDQYLIDLKKRFFIAMVTYDQWHIISSIEKLKKHGIPHKRTPFNSHTIKAIYDGLYNLVMTGRVIVPFHDLLMKEMIYIQRKNTNYGYKIYMKPDAPISGDGDILDSLAGACHSCMNTTVNRLPTNRLVNIETGGAGGTKRMWNSMSGPLGYGTGQEVSNRLDRVNSWSNWKKYNQ